MEDPAVQLATALRDSYTIESELGYGGMATVYLAEDLRHQRKVAVKVLRPELAAVLGAERFLNEIKVTANLQHPHILPLHDSGDANSLLYYVMPYVEGESLRERLNRERQLPIDDALHIAAQVADALGSAHRQGVVHRDIKPENILLSERHALVADFGIALAVTSASGDRLTQTGLSLGTPAYMSPEQVAGDRDIDARSDIYSLACVLYEMLAGQPPFTGATAQVVLARHVTDPVPPITTARSSVSPAVASAISRALGKAPADRFQSVQAFADELGGKVAPDGALGSESSPDTKSIVVLPFGNLSPDPDNAFFADGLTEEIIADLSKVKALRVISRTSAMTLKDSRKDIPTIARELNVRYVLEGSVRRAGNSIRITAQLIDAKNDTHLWAEKYSGTLDDVFDLQEQLSRSIVDELEVTLTSDEDGRIAARPIASVQAHDIWLRARQYTLSLTKDGPERARMLVEEALAIEGDNALLHATLAWVHAVRYSSTVEDAGDVLELAGNHATRALELDPHIAWSHFAASVVSGRRGDIQEFVRSAQRALEIERDSHSLAVLAMYLANAGRIDSARQFADEAAELDPLTWLTMFPRSYVGLMDGRALQGGNEVEATRLFGDVAHGEHPNYSDLSRFIIRALQGERRDAFEVLEKTDLKELAPRDGWLACTVSGCFARLGEPDSAIDWLSQGIEMGFTNHRYLSRHERLLAPIREDPRFEQLMNRAREKERALVV